MKFKMKPAARAVARNMKADSRRTVHITPAQQAMIDAYKAKRAPQAPLGMKAPTPGNNVPYGPKDNAGWEAAWALKRAYAITLIDSLGGRRTVPVTFKQPRTKDIVLTGDTFDQLDARTAW